MVLNQKANDLNGPTIVNAHWLYVNVNGNCPLVDNN